METLRKVTGKVRLTMAQHVVCFMDEIKAYELFITAQTVHRPLEPIKDGPTFRLHRPLIDERFPIKG